MALRPKRLRALFATGEIESSLQAFDALPCGVCNVKGCVDEEHINGERVARVLRTNREMDVERVVLLFEQETYAGKSVILCGKCIDCSEKRSHPGDRLPEERWLLHPDNPASCEACGAKGKSEGD